MRNPRSAPEDGEDGGHSANGSTPRLIGNQMKGDIRRTLDLNFIHMLIYLLFANIRWLADEATWCMQLLFWHWFVGKVSVQGTDCCSRSPNDIENTKGALEHLVSATLLSRGRGWAAQ